MIRRLRLKLIVVSMASLMLVLTAIMGFLNAMNYRGIVQDADSILDILRKNSGELPLPVALYDWEVDGPRYKSPELPFEIRFFSVTTSDTGTAVSFSMVQITALDEETAADYAHQAWKSKSERGFVGDYRFVCDQSDEGLRIIFLDYGRVLSSFRIVLKNSILISIAGLFSVFLLIVILSDRIIKPFMENYAKQKQFITDASHEIKTPITIIDAAAEVLEIEYGENEWLQGIRQQTKRLSRLTGDLIRLARTEEQTQLHMVDFPLSELIEEAAADFHPLALAQEKELRLYIQPNLTWHGDEDGIRQLISILLDNALKYSPKGSVIRLRLELKGKNVCIQTENESTQSLTQSHLGSMFNRFYRGDSSRSSQTAGYGIGLSIAKAIVSTHKGKISARAADENRILITVQLPV